MLPGSKRPRSSKFHCDAHGIAGQSLNFGFGAAAADISIYDPN
jgi:hypothetical protein